MNRLSIINPQTDTKIICPKKDLQEIVHWAAIDKRRHSNCSTFFLSNIKCGMYAGDRRRQSVSSRKGNRIKVRKLIGFSQERYGDLIFY